MAGLVAGLTAALNARAVELVAAASQRVLSETQDAAPVQTGELRSSIAVTSPQVSGNMVECTIGSPLPYAVWTDAGTGIYGPKGVRIFPTTKMALYWEGADHPVRSVEGQKPQDWFGSRGDPNSVMATRWTNALQSEVS